MEISQDFFNVHLGEGENVSLVLFSIFLNDLEHHMLTKNNSNLHIVDLDLDLYLKLVVLSYADDTVVFAKTESEFISLLDTFLDYCKLWKLQVNVDKTKILIFGDKPRHNRQI